MYQTMPVQDIQESSYDASVFVHYNTDVVIGTLHGLYMSVTKYDDTDHRIVVNGSGSGVEDVLFRIICNPQDTFVIVNADKTQSTGIVKCHDVVCVRHKGL